MGFHVLRLNRIWRRVILQSSFVSSFVAFSCPTRGSISAEGGLRSSLDFNHAFVRASVVWDDEAVYRYLRRHGCIDTVEVRGVVALVASGGDLQRAVRENNTMKSASWAGV